MIHKLFFLPNRHKALYRKPVRNYKFLQKESRRPVMADVAALFLAEISSGSEPEEKFSQEQGHIHTYTLSQRWPQPVATRKAGAKLSFSVIIP